MLISVFCFLANFISIKIKLGILVFFFFLFNLSSDLPLFLLLICAVNTKSPHTFHQLLLPGGVKVILLKRKCTRFTLGVTFFTFPQSQKNRSDSSMLPKVLHMGPCLPVQLPSCPFRSYTLCFSQTDLLVELTSILLSLTSVPLYTLYPSLPRLSTYPSPAPFLQDSVLGEAFFHPQAYVTQFLHSVSTENIQWFLHLLCCIAVTDVALTRLQRCQE